MHLVSDNGSETAKLSTRQHKALAALMQGHTIAYSASLAGVSERTLHRWLAEDAMFKKTHKQARRAIVDSVIGSLQVAMPKAVATLIRAMDGKASPNAVRAAQAVLEHGLKAAHLDLIDLTELEELRPLLRQLLDQQAVQRNGGGRWGA